MNKFDEEISSASPKRTDLTASADALKATSAARRQVADGLTEIARDEKQIAEIAYLMQAALDRNTRATEEQSAMVAGTASRVENAARDVYRAIEEEAAKTIKGTADACDAAIKKMERESTRQLEQMQAARRGFLVAVGAVTAVVVLACLLLFTAAVGFMWAQFEAGAGWVASYGWAALPVTVVGAAVVGYLIAKNIG